MYMYIYIQIYMPCLNSRPAKVKGLCKESLHRDFPNPPVSAWENFLVLAFSSGYGKQYSRNNLKCSLYWLAVTVTSVQWAQSMQKRKPSGPSACSIKR